MSRCSERTRGYILMTRAEQDGFTRAFVELAIKSNLSTSERRTLATFEKHWFDGKDFKDRDTFVYFIEACHSHRVPIRYKRKPKKNAGGGAAVFVEWSGHDGDGGSYWPHMDGREAAEIIAIKAKHRRRIMHAHMAALDIKALDYRRDAEHLNDLVTAAVA